MSWEKGRIAIEIGIGIGIGVWGGLFEDEGLESLESLWRLPSRIP